MSAISLSPIRREPLAASNDDMVESSVTATINAPIDKIVYSRMVRHTLRARRPWMVSGAYPDEPTTAPDGKRMSINVEIIGGSLMVQYYVETLGRKDHLALESVSDLTTPTGRTTIHILWEISGKSIDATRCELTNRVRSKAPKEFVTFLDRQGIPLDLFRSQRLSVSVNGNQAETPLITASIERVARARMAQTIQKYRRHHRPMDLHPPGVDPCLVSE